MKTRVSDPATFLGITLSFGLIVTAMYIGGSLTSFIDVPSVLIVITGTLLLTTACFSISEVLKAQGTVLKTVFYNAEDLSHSARCAMQFSDIARKEGFLNLEKHMELADHNPLLKKGLSMIIDNMSAEAIDEVLKHDMFAMQDRHQKGASILRKAAEIAPAMGLIGTLIGLVQMLSNLDDPSSIGPAMAVALLTTFYGAVLAFMVFTPLAAKLERNSANEMATSNIYLKTIGSIIRKENPRQLEILLNSILPPSKRINYFN